MAPLSRDSQLTPRARRRGELPGAINSETDMHTARDIRRASSIRRDSQRGKGRSSRVGVGSGRTSQLPLSTSAAALGRTRQATESPWNTQQPVISSPVNTGSQNHPSGSTSSRKLSAGFTTNGPPSSQPTTGYTAVTASTVPQTSISNHPGPLTSHPTTAYSSMTASGSRGSFDRYAPGPLRQSQTTGNLPTPSTYTRQKGGLQTSRTLLSVPESSGATTSSVAATTAGVIPRFGAENINPYQSEVDLGTRHRDSLEISSIKKIPKRTPPNGKRKVISDISNDIEPIPELPGQILQTVKQKNAEQTAEHTTEQTTKHTTEQTAEQKVPTADKQKQPDLQQPPLQQQPQPQKQHLPKQTFPSVDCINSIDLARIHPSRPQLPPMPMPNSKPKKQSGIPKSRTFGALSNLTSSLSLASLTSNKNNNKINSNKSNNNNSSRSDLRRQIGSPMPIMAPPPNTLDGNASPAEGDSSSPGAIKTPNQASTPAPALATKPIQRNPRMVYNAEPQAYWTGRFVAMQDQLRNEHLKGRNLEIITAATLAQQQQSQAPAPKPQPTPLPTPTPTSDAALPTSYSMACMPGVTPQLLSGEMVAIVQAASEMTDEDNRVRRVFRNLEAQCANRSALDSMHEFQQDYARLVGKKGLLPPGSSWDDNKDQDKDKDKKGWVGRIFSGSSSGGGKKKGNGNGSQ
ncbi:hypothetical protein F5Y00DRAFT_272238 [Daldinia vernicosa]|uniref:uncharacterized protein n=1 Tax=Daldinia vernicosa TaxID=114800 RepID=UPI002007A196|nr:uncharacterized protein F5Y00DRAFT_272238 [Daldinia vernicosa]KAI0846134.1 hypothetical protein F5Y00DRAFT_272238 [Daldinia vernicosa]